MNFRIGELAALFTAVCWTVTSLAFESAGRKVGSIAVNIIRLFIALALLSLFSYFRRGFFVPTDASAYNWFWLALSGIAGFVIGDLFLFKSFTIIGSRISMLIMTLVPPITALIGWMLMGEVLSWLNILGMTLTMSGIVLVIFYRRRKNSKQTNKINTKGLIYAIGGAFGQATGLVLSKFGMEDYDAFSATQIRVIAGVIGFSVIITIFRRWPSVNSALKQTKPMLLMLLGATFGPFLGVSFSLIAVQHIETGIASTIMAITPILIIPPAIVLFKQKVSWKEIVGAVISVSGVALFFI